MEAEAKMKKELASIKKQGQEERETYMEMETKVKEAMKRLQERMNDSAQEVDNDVLRGTVSQLEEQIDDLLKEKAELVEQNEELLEEVSKEREQRSDVEETMKGDIDSIHSCLQLKIKQLGLENQQLAAESKSSKESLEDLQQHMEELCQELDDVSKLLTAEREQRKKLEAEVDEVRKQEEYRAKFGVLDNKDSHLEKKGSLSTLVKKRSERWNVEVYELKKKIEELEKKNRELSTSIDKKTNSVGAIRNGYESKLREVIGYRICCLFYDLMPWLL